MGTALLALQLVEALLPLIPVILPEISSSVAALRQMVEQQRDPTDAEVAAQRALIGKLQAILAAG